MFVAAVAIGLICGSVSTLLFQFSNAAQRMPSGLRLILAVLCGASSSYLCVKLLYHYIG